MPCTRCDDLDALAVRMTKRTEELLDLLRTRAARMARLEAVLRDIATAKDIGDARARAARALQELAASRN